MHIILELYFELKYLGLHMQYQLNKPKLNY